MNKVLKTLTLLSVAGFLASCTSSVVKDQAYYDNNFTTNHVININSTDQLYKLCDYTAQLTNAKFEQLKISNSADKQLYYPTAYASIDQNYNLIKGTYNKFLNEDDMLFIKERVESNSRAIYDGQAVGYRYLIGAEPITIVAELDKPLELIRRGDDNSSYQVVTKYGLLTFISPSYQRKSVKSFKLDFSTAANQKARSRSCILEVLPEMDPNDATLVIDRED